MARRARPADDRFARHMDAACLAAEGRAVKLRGRTNQFPGAARRGVSLVELLVVMSAATVILTTTAALMHRIMLAHSKSRAFVDCERTSLRLANAFRSDVHQAISATTTDEPPPEGIFLQLELPAGQRLEYHREASAVARILRDGERIASRETFSFPAGIDIAIKKDGRLLALSIDSRPSEVPFPDSDSQPPAHAVPVN